MIDTALLFSGGKDSLACLYLNKDKWDQIYVVWLNTGAAYPEMVAYMAEWKKKLPYFVELNSNQPENVQQHGWPVDVLPVNNTMLGRQISGENGPLMQPYVSCCSTNIWFPLHYGVKALGVTKVIKGQRNSDEKKSTARNGSKVDGIEFVMPIQDWTESQVYQYLDEVGAVLPPGYKEGEKTGRDCWDCTAYLSDNEQRIKNLPPFKKAEVLRRLNIIDEAVGKQWVSYGDL